MKKLVLTFFALVAVATTSFAQFVVFTPCDMPRSMCSIPEFTYSAPITEPTLPTYNSVSVPTTTVDSYYRSNGTYVQSHVRTMPNNINWDNYSTKGNTNPYSGSTGYRARDYSREAYNYGRGQTIHSGSRGGQYYTNSRGHKTYVPKRNLW